MITTGYSMPRDIRYQNPKVVADIAKRTGRSSYQVAIKYAIQKGVAPIFATSIRWQ